MIQYKRIIKIKPKILGISLGAKPVELLIFLEMKSHGLRFFLSYQFPAKGKKMACES